MVIVEPGLGNETSSKVRKAVSPVHANQLLDVMEHEVRNQGDASSSWGEPE